MFRRHDGDPLRDPAGGSPTRPMLAATRIRMLWFRVQRRAPALHMERGGCKTKPCPMRSEVSATTAHVPIDEVIALDDPFSRVGSTDAGWCTRFRWRARGRAGAGEPSVSAPGRGRRRWNDEEKARVVRASLRPGERVGEVARRYGVSRWQLSAWRGLARKGKLALAFSTGPEAEPIAVASEPECEPAFATLEVDAAPEPDRGSVSIEARGVPSPF